MGWGLLIGWDLFSLLIIWKAVPGVTNGSLSQIQWALLVGVLLTAVLFTYLGGRMAFRNAPGGRVIQLDESGIKISYPNGRNVTVRWTDPELSLELHDFSDHPELASRIPLYCIVERGITTELTEEAYRAVFGQLLERGLIFHSDRARSFLIPSSVQPIVHQARGSRASQ